MGDCPETTYAAPLYSVRTVDMPVQDRIHADAYATLLGDVRAHVDNKESPSFFIVSVESGARINRPVAGEAAITVGRRKPKGRV